MGRPICRAPEGPEAIPCEGDRKMAEPLVLKPRVLDAGPDAHTLALASFVTSEKARSRFQPIDQLLSRFDDIDALAACA